VLGSVNAITLPSGLTSFLAIDGLNGGSTDAQHVGWFDVSSYDVGALVAAIGGSATFSPLTVTLNATGLTGVLADLARGPVIPSVRLEGVAGGGGTQPPHAVYDLTLGNVTVSDYEDASGGAKLSLSYQQVALTTNAINPNGTVGGSQTFSWDLTTNSAPSAPIPAPVPGTAGSNQITLTGRLCQRRGSVRPRRSWRPADPLQRHRQRHDSQLGRIPDGFFRWSHHRDDR